MTNTMKKRGLVLLLAMAMVMVMSWGSVAFAAEEGEMVKEEQDVEMEMLSDEDYVVVDRKAISDGKARASWGEGILHASDPIIGNPRAYAETKTFGGTAYSLYVRLGMIDNDGTSSSTEKVTASNASSVISPTLLSPTSKCEFMGEHGIKDLSSSQWQTSSTYKRY